MRTSRMFAFCFALIFCGWMLVFSQVGIDKRPTAPPKTSSPETATPPKKAPPKRTALKRSTAGRRNTTTSTAAMSRLRSVVRNQLGMEMVYVPAGSFMMGSEEGEADEKPVHRVTINNGFYMGQYEVTQEQWQQVMGSNPSKFKGCDLCPVEQVLWDDAQEFIRRLNARGDGYTYRLPTEAEWEYACRAGTTTAFAFGDSLSSNQANFDGNYPYGGARKGVYRHKTTRVGSFKPNAFGLYDMHGNVSEWCQDWYYDSYNGAPKDGSAWESGGTQQDQVLRGGSWIDDADTCRSANRIKDKPDKSSNLFGLRIVATARV